MRNKYSIVAIFILIALIGAFYLYRFTGRDLTSFHYVPRETVEEPAPTSTETSRMIVNFEKEGTAVLDNPGLSEGKLFLIYEEPGSPALKAQIVFNAESSCIFGGQTVQCISLNSPIENLLKEKRIRVTGFLQGESLNISTLELLSS